MIHALRCCSFSCLPPRWPRECRSPFWPASCFVVAYNMGEWHEIPSLLKQTKADIAVWITTFALTVIADLTVAVEVGMVLAALLFISRVANTKSVAHVTGTLIEEGRHIRCRD